MTCCVLVVTVRGLGSSLGESSTYYFKNECEDFIRVSKHEKTDETDDAFIVFECLGTLVKSDTRFFDIAS